MIHTLTILDDFLPAPAQARGFALSHDFTQAPEFEGHRYEHFAPVADPKFTAWVEELLSNAIGLPVRIRLATFTCLQEGQGTTQWIHADGVCASHAAVLYLFDGHHDHGTAFWRHKTLGGTQPDSLTEEQAAQIRADGNSTDAWELTDTVAAMPNRLIFYPARRWHSRAQEYGFGDSPETARLTLALFFDIVNPADLPAQ